jgi:hypothetical protein
MAEGCGLGTSATGPEDLSPFEPARSPALGPKNQPGAGYSLNSLAHASIREDGERRIEGVVRRGNAVTVTHCAFSVLAVTVLPLTLGLFIPRRGGHRTGARGRRHRIGNRRAGSVSGRFLRGALFACSLFHRRSRALHRPSTLHCLGKPSSAIVGHTTLTWCGHRRNWRGGGFRCPLQGPAFLLCQGTSILSGTLARCRFGNRWSRCPCRRLGTFDLP